MKRTVSNLSFPLNVTFLRGPVFRRHPSCRRLWARAQGNEGDKSHIMNHSNKEDASHGRDTVFRPRAQRVYNPEEHLLFPSKLEEGRPYCPPPPATAASGREYYVNMARSLRAQLAAARPAASTENDLPAPNESPPQSPPTTPPQAVLEPELMIDKLTVAECVTCLKARRLQVGYRVHGFGLPFRSMPPHACCKVAQLTGTVSSAMVVCVGI
jgi:hypothetical protein